MKTAVIQTGGKQYLVQEGDAIAVEKLAANDGEKITFSEVLLVATGKTVRVGQPLLTGARVEAKLVRQSKHDKVVGVKMKAKKRHKKYFGHRQPQSEIEITKIVASSKL